MRPAKRLAEDRLSTRRARPAHGSAGSQPSSAPSRAAEIAARALAARPGEPEALALAIRAHARAGDAAAALAMLANHPVARQRMSAQVLADAMRDLATCVPASAIEGHVAFAREMIRRGEFEAARRTLEELPIASLATREVRLLRAQVLIRAGALTAARQELEAAGTTRDPEAAILLAIIDAIAGRFVRARRALRRMRADDAGPRLAGACATAIGLSYFLEERFALALTWSRRARRALLRHSPAPASALVNVLEFMALLSLDRTDHAIAFVAGQARAAPPEVLDDPAVRGVEGLLRAAVLGRRGLLREALELGDAGQKALHDRGDHIARLIVLRYQGWAALACGELERAAGYLHECEGVVATSELGGLSAMCELELARLARARGQTDEALARLARMRARSPRNPYAEIEQWALAGTGAPPRAGLEGVTGYVSLRAAERALIDGAIAEGLEFARRAGTWYRNAGAAHELAHAALLHAEALARSGEDAEARRMLADCEAVAAASGYRVIHAGVAVVEAYLADRAGDIAAYVESLSRAHRRAGIELWDAALESAGRRVGLALPSCRPSEAPFASLVARLGLARPCVRAIAIGGRLWLLAPGEPGPAFDVLLDVAAARVLAAQHSVPLQGQCLRLMAALVAAGDDGASLERLYVDHWGTSYHPLRHRSTVYMALSRLRAALRDVDRAVIEQVDGNYRINPRLCVAIAYALPSLASLDELARMAATGVTIVGRR